MNPRIYISRESLARAFAIIGIAAVIVLVVLILAQGILLLKKPLVAFRDLLKNRITLVSKFIPGTSPTTTPTLPVAVTTPTTTPSTSSGSGVGVTAGPKKDTTVNMGDVTTPGTDIGGEAHASSGKPDLIIRFKEMGYLDRSTNAFTPVTSQSLDRSLRIGIKFDVVNVGGSSTGRQWNFNAYLPTSPAFIYNADMQKLLNPGEKIEYTLGFDRLSDQRSNTLRILLDGGNLIDEVNEGNNEIQVVIPTL